MAEDILEGALDVWVQVRVLPFERFGLAHADQVASRSLQLNSVSMASTFRIVRVILHSRTSPWAVLSGAGTRTVFGASCVQNRQA